MNKRALIILTKNPVLGQAKTRLARSIGNENALDIFKILLQHTVNITSALEKVDKFVFYANEIPEKDIWPNEFYQKNLQINGDIGQKMHHAFQEVFKQDYKEVILIGSDCLDLQTETIEHAFNHLKTNNTVIGPSLDGGYYLIGFKKDVANVFENKTWSTSSVYEDTINDFNTKKLSFKKLPYLSDIDEVENVIPHQSLHQFLPEKFKPS